MAICSEVFQFRFGDPPLVISVLADDPYCACFLGLFYASSGSMALGVSGVLTAFVWIAGNQLLACDLWGLENAEPLNGHSLK